MNRRRSVTLQLRAAVDHVGFDGREVVTEQPVAVADHPHVVLADRPVGQRRGGGGQLVA